MPWNEPGGGSDKDPWSKGSSKGGKANNIEDISKKMNEKLGGIFGKSGGDSGEGPSMTTLGLIALLALFAWLATGFYTIGAAEQGVEFRFGAYKRLTEPGWHWQFPSPIESVEIVNVDKAREAEDDNIHMLTKDENIINLSVSAQYKVKDVKDYLFNIIKPDFERDQPQGTLYQVMRSALREVAGRNTLDMILTENRASIASETQKEMQNILDQYGSGLELIKVNLTNATVPREVKEAFDDVNKAREDLERYKHEAETYAKRVVPVAKGKASRLLENASAYKSRIVARSEGDASRFSQLVTEYRKAPEVTRKRLYLETIEGVYKNSKKVLIDTKSGNNMLYLPLNQLQGSTAVPSDSNNAAISAGMNELLRQQKQQPPQTIRDSSRSGVRQGRFQ
jgi:membrane protease subunit HflK